MLILLTLRRQLSDAEIDFIWKHEGKIEKLRDFKLRAKPVVGIKKDNERHHL